MTEAYELTSKKPSEVGARPKQRYDRSVRSSVLLPGDRVLVRNLSGRGGPGKLRSHWEDRVHVIVRVTIAPCMKSSRRLALVETEF